MTDASTSQSTMTPPTAPQPYKLMRARKGRMLAGVAAGLARSSGFDVTVVRLLMGIAMLTSFGLGVVAYILLWIVLPEEQPSRGRVIEPAPENTARTIRIVLVAGAIVAVLSRTGVFWPFGSAHANSDFGFDGILGLILLSLGVGVLFSRHRPDRSWWEASQTPPPAATSAAPAATPAPADGDAHPTDDDDPVTYVGPTRYVAAPVHNAITEALEQARTKDDTATMGAVTPNEPRRGTAALGWARAFGWFVLLWWTGGAIALVGLWRFGAVNITAPVVLFVAAWLAFTAVINSLIRVRNASAVMATLLLLAVPPMIASALVRADGPVGSRTVRPIDHVDLNYKQAIGSLTLDFSETKFDTVHTTTIHTKVGTGAQFITVPNDVALEVDTDIRAGGYIVLGKQTRGGFGQSETMRFEGCPGAPKLHLELRNGAGWMEVKRANNQVEPTCEQAA